MARHKAQKATKKPKKSSRKRMFIETVCNFPGGDSRRLLVTGLSLGGAFVLSLRPPLFGTSFSMILYPGPTPLPAIDARVIGLRIDPTNIDRCGFEVVFTQVSDALLSQLATVIEQLDQNIIRPRREQLCPQPDRRQHPRVLTQLEAAIHLPHETTQAKVADLSIAGALLRLEQKATPFIPGDELQVSIIAPNAPEHLSLTARVVRVVAGDETAEVGVAFTDINEVVQRRLEGLILDAFIEEYELTV
jgi:hypothetical protein